MSELECLLIEAATQLGLAEDKLALAKDTAPPPLNSEIREQIKALRSLTFCINDMANQVPTGEK